MNIKTELLVIYNSKDEELYDHIESLIMAEDDTNSQIVGVKDNSAIVYKCLSENYKKLNNTADKYLFVDCVPPKSVENLLFNKYGVSYGTLDKDHFYIKINDSYLWDRASYDSFLCELNLLTDNPIACVDAYKDSNDMDYSPVPTLSDDLDSPNATANAMKALIMCFASAIEVAKTVKQANELKKEWKYRTIRRKQLLYYGLTKFYLNDMESLLNKG